MVHYQINYITKDNTTIQIKFYKLRGNYIELEIIMKCDFGTVSERDMDMLFLNVFSVDKDFLSLFTDKAGLPHNNCEIKEIYLSKADKDGESDITLIIEHGGSRYGILIEDKIDAIAMPEQPERYIKRGNKGVKNNEYKAFYSFIVCPEKYYKNNDAAKKYPYSVMYEEIRKFFKDKENSQYELYYQQVNQAIEKAKKPPKVVVDETVNKFFRKYKDYQEQNYPELQLATKRESNGYWAHYNMRFGSVYLYHKIGEGYVDLTFNKAAKSIDKLEIVADWLRKHNIANTNATVTGKSGALRVIVPKLNMHIPFEENDKYDIEVCFKTISELVETMNVFGVASSVCDLK